MGVGELLPSGILLTTAEKMPRHAPRGSGWPATPWLARGTIELMRVGAWHNLVRFGTEKIGAIPAPGRPDDRVCCPGRGQSRKDLLRETLR